jgi:type I restriction enzyme, S subunit
MYLRSTATQLTREGATFTRTVPAGTLILTNSGATLGVPKITALDGGANDGIAVLMNPQWATNEYLYFVLESRTEYFRDHLAPGNGQPNLNTELIKEEHLLLPPIDEQHALASLFKLWDSAIEKTERLINAKKQRFSGLLDRLVFRRSRSDSEFRLTPLHRIADRVQRQADGAKYPLLTISAASGFVRQEDKYSRYMAGESAKTYTLLKRGEFAYNKGNSLRYEFGCVFPLLDYDAALVPSVYVSFSLREGVNPAYLQHVFAADYLKPQLRALVKTGVRNNGLLNIRPDEFMGTSVPLPPLVVQHKIAAVLDEAREEIRLLALELAALRIQKRGLMQKLLTGKWRVPIDEGVTA